MKIKLLKAAQWDGKKNRKGSIHDVDDRIADKLISRGYAEQYDEVAETPEQVDKDDANSIC